MMGSALSYLRRLWTTFSAPQNDRECRQMASRLAGTEPHDVLTKKFERHAEHEEYHDFLACLLQEMLIRGADVLGSPPLVKFHEQLTRRGHALAYLPLILDELENNVGQYVHRYGPNTSSVQVAVGPVPATQPVPVGTETQLVVLAVVNAPPDITAAVREWQARSNGSLEARVFGTARPLTENDLSVTLLRSLGLDCLDKVTDLRAERITPNRAVEILFSAASAGGAYPSEQFGAYGRLSCWQSVAAMVGIVGESFKAVAEAARRSMWVEFHASSPWFYDVAWDIGLIAVRPGGESLAVLAATDTD